MILFDRILIGMLIVFVLLLKFVEFSGELKVTVWVVLIFSVIYLYGKYENSADDPCGGD